MGRASPPVSSAPRLARSSCCSSIGWPRATASSPDPRHTHQSFPRAAFERPLFFGRLPAARGVISTYEIETEPSPFLGSRAARERRPKERNEKAARPRFARRADRPASQVPPGRGREETLVTGRSPQVEIRSFLDFRSDGGELGLAKRPAQELESGR